MVDKDMLEVHRVETRFRKFVSAWVPLELYLCHNKIDRVTSFYRSS